MSEKLMLYQKNATECREMARRAKAEFREHYEKIAQTWEMLAKHHPRKQRDTND